MAKYKSINKKLKTQNTLLYIILLMLIINELMFFSILIYEIQFGFSFKRVLIIILKMIEN